MNTDITAMKDAALAEIKKYQVVQRHWWTRFKEDGLVIIDALLLQELLVFVIAARATLHRTVMTLSASDRGYAWKECKWNVFQVALELGLVYRCTTPGPRDPYGNVAMQHLLFSSGVHINANMPKPCTVSGLLRVPATLVVGVVSEYEAVVVLPRLQGLCLFLESLRGRE